MSFKTILAIIGTEQSEYDISRAIDLSTSLSAHLSILILGVAIPPMTADYPVASIWLEQREEQINGLRNVQVQAEKMCLSYDVSFDIEYLYDDGFILASNVAMRALYADVVIVGDGVRTDGELRKTVVAATVFDAHASLLMLPTSRNASLKPRNILLAWNSRAEAASAAKAAMGLMTAADIVHITIVDPDDAYWKNGGEPGADIATFLVRHGVNAVVDQLASGGRAIEEVLEQHALEVGSDFIVMGAYGHTRLRERLFGGVTASILKGCKFPVFLAR